METIIMICMGLWFFFLGCALGSFYNVVVDRLPNDRGIVFGRSECESCHHKLSLLDLIPIFSFLFLKARCRYCGKKLSPQYLLSEIAVGGLFLVAFLLHKDDFQISKIITVLSLWSMLFVVAMMDQKHGIIIDQVLLVFTAIGVAAELYTGVSLKFMGLGFLSGIVFYALIYLVAFIVTGKECFGLGDVMLMGAIGAFLGPHQTIITGFLSFYCSLIFIIFNIVKNKGISNMQAMPFGPSMCMAAFIMSLWGEPITVYIGTLLGF